MIIIKVILRTNQSKLIRESKISLGHHLISQLIIRIMDNSHQAIKEEDISSQINYKITFIITNSLMVFNRIRIIKALMEIMN